MTEYNGSIELIAGLKPKNNGDFPLLNAPDVLMPDGRRLSEIDFENLGGGDTFPVPFGLNTETIDTTCEVSYSEIATAVEESKFVYGILDWVGMPVVLPFKGLISLEGTFALFETALDFMGLQMSVLIHENGEIETQASQITDGGASTPPTNVDLSRLDSDGIIEETFADGSVKTTVIEYDSTGNPVKITDGDGNVTEFTW